MVNYFLVISCVVCAWAMLRLVGSERMQMMKDLESQLRRQAKKAAEATRVKEEILVVSSAPIPPAPAALKPKN